MDFIPRLDREHVASIIGIAAAAALIYSTFSFVSKGNKTQNKYKEIPTPRSSYPYIGHMLSLGKYPTRTLSKWHQELGPIIKLKMGVQTWVSLNDPQLAHELFSHKGIDSSRRPLTNFGLHYSYNERGVIFGNGERWKASRGALLSVLAPKMVDKYMEKIEFESSDLIERLLKTTEKDGSVDPVPDLQMNSLNVISHVTVGKRYDSKDDPEFMAICKMYKNAVKLTAFEIDIPSFLPILSFIKYIYNSEKLFTDFVQKERDPILHKLIKEATFNSDINIMKALDSEGFNITPIEKLVILSDVIGAGEDTTETTLSWAIAILCHYPQVQKNIQEELDMFFKKHNARPTFSQRDQVPYTVSVMKECMRYRPITAFGVPHETTNDVELGQYIIPKGTIVLTSMRSLHENPDAYEDPEKFIPERFLNNTKSMYAAANGRVSERDHFNFGWGRRICPGIYLAEVEIFNSYVSLFSKCTIEPVVDEHNKPIYPDIEGELNSGVIVGPIQYNVKVSDK
ncbi:cytochrome P450, partial [Backusella circina FSU 941]